jgi:hypothetical protein
VSSIALAEHDRTLVAALRKSKGTATLGDVVAATGLPRDSVESGLKSLLETRQGNLAVSESGELIYQFDPKLIERDHISAAERFRTALWAGFQKAFKVGISVVLVVYFLIFVALVIAALFANKDDRRGGGILGGGRRGGHRHGGGFNNFFLWYWLMGGPRWRLGRPYYGRRWEQTLSKESRVPFYKKVFAFVFGPDEPKATLQQKDRSLLRLIRARKGVLSAGELVEHTALPLPEAEGEMGRLMASYSGEPTVSPEGEIVYAFPELMTSATGKVRVKEPNPAWMRLEYDKDLTGNDGKSNAMIAAINGFNLVAGATAPWFIFPRLGISGPAAFVGLVVIPVLFSIAFFGIPLMRSFSVKAENRRRAKRNIRRLLLGLVYSESLGAVKWIGLPSAVQYVQARLKQSTAKQIETELNTLAAEFDADVDTDEAGALRFRFPNVRKAFVESEITRRSLRLDERELGAIVYSSGDDANEASAREMENFDRELAAAEMDLSSYLPSAGNVAFEDDYEIVALDDDLTQGAPLRA